MVKTGRYRARDSPPTTRPEYFLTMEATMCRPSPERDLLVLVETLGRKMRGRISAGMPGAVIGDSDRQRAFQLLRLYINAARLLHDLSGV